MNSITELLLDAGQATTVNAVTITKTRSNH